MNRIKTFFAMLLTTVLLFAIVPVNTYAADAKTTKDLYLKRTVVKLSLESEMKQQLVIGNLTKDFSVKWSSSDKKVAVVSKDGTITPKGKGKCTIKAKVTNKKKTSDKCTFKCKVTIVSGKSGTDLLKALSVAQADFVDKNGARETAAVKDYNVTGLNFTKTLDYDTEESWMNVCKENELSWYVEAGGRLDLSEAQLPILDKANPYAATDGLSPFGIAYKDKKANDAAVEEWKAAANIYKGGSVNDWILGLAYHNRSIDYGEAALKGPYTWKIRPICLPCGGGSSRVVMYGVYLEEYGCSAVLFKHGSFWNSEYFSETGTFFTSTDIIYLLSLITAYPQEVFDMVYGGSEGSAQFGNFLYNEWIRVNDVYVYWDAANVFETSWESQCDVYIVPVNAE